MSGIFLKNNYFNTKIFDGKFRIKFWIIMKKFAVDSFIPFHTKSILWPTVFRETTRQRESKTNFCNTAQRTHFWFELVKSGRNYYRKFELSWAGWSDVSATISLKNFLGCLLWFPRFHAAQNFSIEIYWTQAKLKLIQISVKNVLRFFQIRV